MNNDERTRVRLWVFWNGAFTRITILAGRPVVLSRYAATEEGFESNEDTYSLVDGQQVQRKAHRRARDCDGPLETFEYRIASISRLAALETSDPAVTAPDWQ